MPCVAVQRHISLRYTSDDIVRVREHLEATTPRRPHTPGTVNMGTEGEDDEDIPPQPTLSQQQAMKTSLNSSKTLKTSARGLPTPKKALAPNEEDDFVPPSPFAMSRSGAPPPPPPAPVAGTSLYYSVSRHGLST